MATRTTPRQDRLHRFLIDGTHARGVLVRLHESWATIRAMADYPPAIMNLLGEAVTAVALFGGHTKIDGRLSLHLKSGGPLRRVFAEYAHPGALRGLAHWEGEPDQRCDLRQLGPDALLAIGIEARIPGTTDSSRYQGLVDLDADSLSVACEQYFSRSEQLPTWLMLHCDEDQTAGLLVQQLPGARTDPDAWNRVRHLLATLTTTELVEQPAEVLLHSLFHEDGVRLLSSQELHFGCSCSRQRVEQMFLGLGRSEAMAALEDNLARVTCEFCGREYRIDRIDMMQLFIASPAPAPETRQ